MRVSGTLAAIACAFSVFAQPLDLTGKPRNPFATPASVRVLLFVRTDCPITNRYAPELQRLAGKFTGLNVEFWLVYPDRAATPSTIGGHILQYHLPGKPLRDPHHELVKLAHATITPEAAVFDRAGHLLYHGRIDDRWVEIGKARPAPQTHDLEDAIAAVLAGKPVPHSETRAIGCTLADLQ